jgi:hypothetical protein
MLLTLIKHQQQSSLSLVFTQVIATALATDGSNDHAQACSFRNTTLCIGEDSRRCRVVSSSESSSGQMPLGRARPITDSHLLLSDCLPPYHMYQRLSATLLPLHTLVDVSSASTGRCQSHIPRVHACWQQVSRSGRTSTKVVQVTPYLRDR